VGGVGSHRCTLNEYTYYYVFIVLRYYNAIFPYKITKTCKINYSLTHITPMWVLNIPELLTYTIPSPYRHSASLFKATACRYAITGQLHRLVYLAVDYFTTYLDNTK
jgi:hypothetical protein